jgi:hypothetical protein
MPLHVHAEFFFDLFTNTTNVAVAQR